MSTQWYYTENGQQQGPVGAQELRARAESGRLLPTDLVWREGMENWVEARRVKGLLPAAPPAAPAASPLSLQPDTAPNVPAPAVSPYDAPAMHTQTYGQSEQGYAFSEAPVKPANFWLYFGLYLGGFILAVIGLGMGMTEEDPSGLSGSSGSLMILLLGVVALVVGFVLYCIYIYRAWFMIQSGRSTRTTPGKAVGFLFIPFFNLYWVFIALHGWSKDYHDFLDEHALYEAPRVNENLFLAAAILTVVGGFINALAFISIIVTFVAMYQMCKAINYFAAQSQQ
ncbi:MAG: DUF4339 domain-containing protein [Neisseria sp.]|nr:DUF4339 domain-containing protein [Neisseria sp.]